MRFSQGRLACLVAALVSAPACNAIFGITEGTPEGTSNGGSASTGSSSTSGSSTGSTSTGSTSTGSTSTGSTSSGTGGASCSTPGQASCSTGVLTVCDQSDQAQMTDCGAVALCDPTAQKCSDPGRLSLGTMRSCAVDDHDDVYCWGNNGGSPTSTGSLVIGDAHLMFPSAQQIPALSAVQVSVADDHQCALHPGGTVACWGEDVGGVLGVIPESDATTKTVDPVLGLPSSSYAVEVSTASGCSCARLDDGSVWCWGLQDNGCTGTAATMTGPRSTPTKISLPAAAVELRVGDGVSAPSCARLVNGGVTCWSGYFTPIDVPGVLGATGAIDIAPAGGLVFILGSNGEVSWSSMTPPGTGVGGAGGGVADDGGPGSWTMGSPVLYTAVNQLGQIAKIAAGSWFCGAVNDGSLVCSSLWEDLDALPVTALPMPAQVTVPGMMGSIAELASGLDFNFDYGGSLLCARFTGPAFEESVYCWGDDYNGALGLGGIEYPTSAVALSPAFSSPVAALSAGEYSTTAVLMDGTAHYWGSGVTYVGNDTGSDVPSSALVSLGTNNAALRTSDAQQLAYALKNDGTLMQLDDNGMVSTAPPQRLQAYASTSFKDVQPGYVDMGLLSPSAGAYASQVVVFVPPVFQDVDGNACGLLGNGTTMTTPASGVLQPVPNLTASLLSYWAGNYYARPAHACAVPLSGGLVCWGSNGSGESGYVSDPMTDPLPVPTAVTLPGVTHAITSVAAGVDFTCATDGPPPGSGQVYCWGANDYGQLGLSMTPTFTTMPATPAPVLGIMNHGGTSPAVAVSAGQDHVCAVLENGTVMCWGCNDYGQLGNGNYTDQGAPGLVMGLASDVMQVSAGYNHTCAVHAAGAVSCWGSSYRGQAGIGPMIDGMSPTPKVVQGL